jgi:hypothetical protein
MIIVFGCLKRVVMLVILLAVGVRVWLNRDRLRSEWTDLRGGAESAPPATPVELAQLASQKLATLADGPPPERIVLSSAELQSLLRTRFSGILPGYVDSATVELEDGRVHLKARVPTSELRQMSGLGQVASLLPDTTEIGVTGQLIPLEDGRVAIAVDQVSAAKIPLPRKLIPRIIRKIQPKADAGVPVDALVVPLPAGARSAYVRGDSLVLLATGSRAQR